MATFDETYRNSIQKLAQARREAGWAKHKADELEAQLKATTLGQQVELAKAAAKRKAKQEQAAYEEVRGLALDCYEATGDTEPHPAVKIKLYTVLDYDPSVARNWSAEHMPDLLVLDKKAFERVAKAAPMDFVEIEKEPRPTIARDLAEWE